MQKVKCKKSLKLKIMFMVFALSLLCSLTAWGAMMGDVNGNGSVNIVDGLMVAQYYVGLNPAGFQAAYADVDGNGSITIVDALMIAQYYVGLITQFPNQGNPTAMPTATPTTTGGESTTITLNGSSISISGTGATASGSVVTISSGGTYTVRGTLTNGQILVNSTDTNQVTINLSGVNISNSTTAPIYILAAEETEIVLVSGTTNTVSDASTYVYTSGEDEPNAAIFSNDDLKFSGSGALTVKGNYLDGISSDDGINFKSGTYTINITAKDDGVRGKDDVKVKGGTITINAGGDGIKTTNSEETNKGYITVENGNVNITAGGDGFSAETTLTFSAGTLNITTGGGSGGTVGTDESRKGIKGIGGVTINGGTFTLNCADDSVHSNGDVSVTGGTFTIATGDDGFHSDTNLVVGGGVINITKSYEGLEAFHLTINGGNIHLVADDDGLNAADPSISATPFVADTSTMNLNGGYVVIDITNGRITGSTGGDGIDCNGAITISNGTYIIHGSNEVDSAIDYDGSCTNKGGLFVGAGSSQMAMAPGNRNSTQNSLLLNLSSRQQANTIIRIQNSSGAGIVTFKPSKEYQSLAFSSSQLVNGTYTVYLGGSCSGTVTDGLYEGGTYSGGTQYTTFTVSSPLTTVGGGGWGGGF